MASLSEWVYAEVVKLLGPDTPRAYSDYIVEIQEPQEVEEYLLQLCGGENQEIVSQFVELLTVKRSRIQDNVSVYKKGDDDAFGQRSVRPKKRKEPKKVMTLDDISTVPATKTPLDTLPKPAAQSPKKKTTYVSLYGKDGETRTHAVLLPGRNVCECQAQKHRLVNNCLSCGRVVCEQEGSGPCLFCGKMVCTPEEKKVLARDSKKSERLMKKLTSVGGGGALTEDNTEVAKGLAKAEEYKNRLLEYDRTYVQRTKVIDDESDYYATDSNVWLSPKERETMKKREQEVREAKFGSRLNRKVTLDFAGRRVIDEDVHLPMASLEVFDEKPQTNPTLQESFPDLPMPQYVPKNVTTSVKEHKTNATAPASGGRQNIGRLQDKELQQMSDLGACLSMHQPWASLLVKGIKKHEGRSWYSNHRGRLWIAAASHKPTSEEIAAVEQQHLAYVDSDVELPTDYPISCLLGCVNVEDVLPQQEYRTMYPRGESMSAYVFVCSGFEELLVKVPVSGKHKIWKLPPIVHQNAKKGRTILHDQF